MTLQSTVCLLLYLFSKGKHHCPIFYFLAVCDTDKYNTHYTSMPHVAILSVYLEETCHLTAYPSFTLILQPHFLNFLQTSKIRHKPTLTAYALTSTACFSCVCWSLISTCDSRYFNLSLWYFSLSSSYIYNTQDNHTKSNSFVAHIPTSL